MKKTMPWAVRISTAMRPLRSRRVSENGQEELRPGERLKVRRRPDVAQILSPGEEDTQAEHETGSTEAEREVVTDVLADLRKNDLGERRADVHRHVIEGER